MVDVAATSDYWRKLLHIDKDEPGDVLAKFNYPHRHLRPFFYFLFGLLARFYLRVKAVNIGNLPGRPPYIIAPNHASSLDYPLVAYAIGKKRSSLYVLATKFFFDNVFARVFMKIAANVQRIDIVDDFIPGVRAAAQILKRGKSVYIQPEGTRSETGNLLPFRPGVGMLAAELGVPIVPVYIHGAINCLPSGSVFIKPGRIDVNFGRPITVSKYRDKLKAGNAYYVYKEITEEVRDSVQKMRDACLK